MATVKTEKTLDELTEGREWWWVAEKTRSKRLDYLRKAAWKKGANGGEYTPGLKLSMTQARLFTEAWRENELDPIMLRKAKAHANVFKNIPLFITDHAQIMGYLGAAPHEMIWNIQSSSAFNDEAYNEPGIHAEPEEESLRELADLSSYWAGKTAQDLQLRRLDPEDAVKFSSGAISWGSASSMVTYCTKDFNFIFKGFEAIMDEIEDRMDAAEELVRGVSGPELLPLYDKLHNWEAMLITLEACMDHAERYAFIARIIAEEYESDPQRKEELLRIAETCERVPAKPPRNLQESIQFDHFVQIFTKYETYEVGWPHRPDYIHSPFYYKDVVEEKRITKEDAIDLIGEDLIRAYEVGIFSPRYVRESVQGIVGPWVWTLGGTHVDGSDACDDCTLAFLEAAKLVRVSNPTFSFRWHIGMREDVQKECFECIRQGLGYPSMRNDPVLVDNLMYWFGHPLHEARQWVVQACMSPCPPTKQGCQPMRMAVVCDSAKIIEYVLSNGWDDTVHMQLGCDTGDPRNFKTYEEFFDAWKKQMEYMLPVLARTANIGRTLDKELFSRPVLSVMYERAVETGTDATDPSNGERGNAWLTFFSWMENVDSLAAVKKMIFEDKKYTMDELITALKANWEGYEEMRLDFVNNVPKWGNDDDYVDSIMTECMAELRRESWALKDVTGNPWPCLLENASGNIHYANMVRALPNGRRLGDALYDGGISPGPGLDKKGPTAVLKSCSKFDHVGDGRSFLLNQRLSPTQLAGEKGYQLWKAYMRTWSDLKLDHVQFNMVDDATLYAAQKDPEEYQELIVRVAGYSAHFIDISRKTQDNIIQRTIQGLG
jgi:formate C-acetyltransferase/benzylsuccinate synthase